MDISKRDWKLFRDRIGKWQEAYMDKLSKEYIGILSKNANPSDKFWELEKRIKADKRKPGVLISLNKRDMIYDIAALIRDEAIGFDDLNDFSDELKDSVQFLLNMHYKT